MLFWEADDGSKIIQEIQYSGFPPASYREKVRRHGPDAIIFLLFETSSACGFDVYGKMHTLRSDMKQVNYSEKRQQLCVYYASLP
jgi:hypothetical protein